MFHLALLGTIETIDPEFAKKLEDFIKQNDSKINGRFVSYNITDFEGNDKK